MPGVSVDVSQLEELSGDLRAASKDTVRDARLVVSRGAQRIKNDWRAQWAGLSHAPSLAAAVTMEVRIHAHDIAAEIGPDKNLRQGALGNIIEFGTVNNAPQPAGAPALAKEEPLFLSAAEKLAAGLLK